MNKYAKMLIKCWEGCRLNAYDDGTGIWTIGYGHINGVKAGLTIIQEQADAWLNAELADFEKEVTSATAGLNLQEWQHGALISFSYNVGITAFKSSTLLQTIKADTKNYDDITREFLKWDNAGGVELTGLSKRRINEADVYTNGEMINIAD